MEVEKSMQQDFESSDLLLEKTDECEIEKIDVPQEIALISEYEHRHDQYSYQTKATTKDGLFIVTPYMTGKVVVEQFKQPDAAVPEYRQEYNHGGGFVTGVACSENGFPIVSANMEGRIKVWQEGKQDPVQEYNHEKLISAVACSEDGSLIVSADNEGGIKVWQQGKQDPVQEYNHDDNHVTKVELSKDCSLIKARGYFAFFDCRFQRGNVKSEVKVKVWKRFLELKKGSKEEIDPLKVKLTITELVNAIQKNKKKIELHPEQYTCYQFINEQLEGSIDKKIEVEELGRK